LKKYIAFIVLMFSTALVVFYLGLRLPTPAALVVLVMAVGADFLTTYLCLRQSGREGNPVMAFLFRRVGIGGTYGLMVCVWIAVIWFRWLPTDVGSQTAIAFTYWLVPLNNLIVLRRLHRMNRKNTAMQNC